jgi:hypothetical protein
MLVIKATEVPAILVISVTGRAIVVVKMEDKTVIVEATPAVEVSSRSQPDKLTVGDQE